MAGLAIGGVIRAAARVMIPSLVAQGLGARRIVATLRTAQLGYRYANMLQDIRAATHYGRWGKQVEAVAMSDIVPRYMMIETYIKRARRYMVRFKVSALNAETNETETRWFTVLTDTLKTKAEMATDFLLPYVTWPSRPELQITGINVAEVAHQRGGLY